MPIQFPSEGREGRTESFWLQVARDHVKGHDRVHKFGAVPSMSINTTGTIWDVNDTLYPWTALDTPAVVNVERNNASDNGLTVTVQGLDENYKVAEDTIEITGADQVGTQLFRRVNRAFVTDGATTNVGNIDIEAGADATGNMFVRFFGQDTFRIAHSFEVVGSGGAYVYEFAIPNPVTEKSDIDIRASVRSNNGRYTAAWDMVLIKNEAS